MKDILLAETCEKCGKPLTLMESINMDTDALMLVKRCLSCYGRPVEEVAQRGMLDTIEAQQQEVEQKDKAEGCGWCLRNEHTIIDDDFGQPVSERHIKYCFSCGKKLGGTP